MPTLDTDKRTYKQNEVVRVNGGGYTPKRGVSFGISRKNDTKMYGRGHAWANSQGVIIGSFRVPMTTPAGPQKVTAFDHHTNQYSNSVQVTVTAIAPLQYKLNIVVSPLSFAGTTVPFAGYHRFPANQSVTIDAKPSFGWIFKHWKVDNRIITANPTDIMMNRDTVVTAVFSQVTAKQKTVRIYTQPLNVTVSLGGRIYGSGSSFTFTPVWRTTLAVWNLAGHTFSRWEGTGAVTFDKPTGKSTTVTLSGDASITAICT